MIATCTNCPARYQLEDAKIPEKIIQVRCPSCQGVFTLDGTKANLVDESNEAYAMPETQDSPSGAKTGFEDPNPAAPSFSSGSNYHEIPEEPEVEVETTASVAPSVATLDEPAADTGTTRRRRRCKEEMLARALVSDILVYNRDTRDAGLAEGNLLEVLGGEIKKSWELYKEKVTPEVANSTTYFREALNEILADGGDVF